MRRSFLLIAVLFGVGCGQPPPSGSDGGAPPPDAGHSGVGPILTGSSPANGATTVAADTAIVLEFSEPIDRSSFTLGANPPALFGAPTYDFDDTVVTVSPTAALLPDTQYLLQGTARDLEGNSGSYSISFKVAEVDSTSPTLVQMAPTELDAALDAPIVLTFSEAMDPSTVVVTTTPAADFRPTVWNDVGTQATFAPTVPWKLATEYSVIVAGKDLAGNLLGGTITFKFRTLKRTETVAPTVRAHSPTTKVDAPLNTKISVAFSEPMLASTVEAAFVVVPDVGCQFSWTAARDAVTCTPAAPLTKSTKYTVLVGTGAQDAQANALASPYTFTFETGTVQDLVAPSVVGSLPADKTVGEPQAASLTLLFSEEMDVAATQGALTISGTGSEDGTLTWNPAGTALTWKPKAPLPYGETISWKVAATARDIAGNALVGISQGTFRVIRTGSMDLPAVIDGFVGNDGVWCDTCLDLEVGYKVTNSWYRAFYGFDLNDLPPNTKTINSASLNVYQSGCSGNPFGNLGTLRADSVDFGPSLTSSDFNALQVGPSVSIASSCGPRWVSATVTNAVAADLAAFSTRQGRSQFRIQFSKEFFFGFNDDLLEFASHMDTTHAPYLRVSYDYP